MFELVMFPGIINGGKSVVIVTPARLKTSVNKFIVTAPSTTVHALITQSPVATRPECFSVISLVLVE
jgi:hypothetical protein